MRRSTTVVDGAVGGMLAGAVVAAWFFVVDLATGHPFHTPQVLAAALLGHEPTLATARLVAVYTLLHLGVFTALGIAGAWLMHVTGEVPRLLTGALFGVGALSATHYGGLLLLGVPVLTLLPPVHVLAANLLGGVAMMLYLHQATQESVPFGPAMLKNHPLVVDGLVTGTIGAAAIALWFLIVDALAGRPLFTPAALGSAFLLGAQSPNDVQLTVGIIVAYTLIHVLAFFAVGVGIEWGARQLERFPSFWLVALMAVIVLDVLFVGIVGSLALWVLGAVGLWAVVIGNLLAVGAMGYRVWRERPELRHRFAQMPEGTRA
ncbi:MAG TPA: hypothetical protein VH539_02860 [Gemmatimonadaceae bacterium]|jgi:hypothetical protein